MSMLRGRLFAGALFSGALFGLSYSANPSNRGYELSFECRIGNEQNINRGENLGFARVENAQSQSRIDAEGEGRIENVQTIKRTNVATSRPNNTQKTKRIYS